MAPRWVLLSLVGAAIAAAEASALSITASPIAAPAPGSLQQDLTAEKTWTIETDEVQAQLRALDVQVAGNVRVELDEELAAAAAVVVRSSSHELLELMNVTVVDTDAGSNAGSGDGVRLHYKDQHAHVVAWVETRVLVSQRHLLRAVHAMYAQNVVLTPGVVVRDAADAELYLSAVGSTVLFVEGDAAPISLRRLTAIVSGDGGVQVVGKTIQAAEEITLSVAGAGRVAVVADSVSTRDVVSAIAGDGNTWVQTTSGVTTTTMHTSIVGAGAATFAPAGTCSSQTISIAGSGHVFAGGVKCENADVSIVGDGHATVQAVNRLTTSTILTGTVKYVGSKPRKVETHGIAMHGRAFSTISHTERDSFPVYERVTAPSSGMATTVNLLVEPSTNADAPSVRVTPFVDTALRLGSVSMLLSPGVGALLLFEFAVVVLALAAFSVMRFRQRRIREKYTPLP